MSDIKDFISAAVQDRPSQAMDAFLNAIEPKLDAALSARYDQISQSIFNQPAEQEMEEYEDE